MLTIMILIIIIVISLVVETYTHFERRHKFVDVYRANLIKKYNTQKYTFNDNLSANFYLSIIDRLDSIKTLKEKELFIKNL